MKIIADVSISYWQNPAGGGRLRAARSSIAIGCQPGAEEPQILLQTVQNKTGTHYKIRDNISQLFTSCLSEGKATIRLCSPAHDLIIKCEDKLQLKCFIQTLKHVTVNKVASVRLSNLNSKKAVIPKQRTSLTISTKSDYPVLKSFPRCLLNLSVNSIEMKRIDSKILQLYNLQVLNLSDNSIKNLPESLGDLRSLTTLNLSHNLLQETDDQHGNWLWMNSQNFVNKLRMLDISFNGLLELPMDLTSLKTLVHLKVNDNKIEKLPGDIGRLKNLKYFSVANNSLVALPYSIQKLRLHSIDVAGNNDMVLRGVNAMNPPTPTTTRIDIPSLVELAARVLINEKLRYPTYAVPKRIANYLRMAEFCACGSSCFQTCGEECIHPLTLDKISETVTSHFHSSSVHKCNFFPCSQKCADTFSKPKHFPVRFYCVALNHVT